MSKKKGKAAPARASKKTAARRRVSGARTALTAATTGGRTVTATIFIYRTGSGNKIRTSPQRVYANAGDRVEWSVVNLVDGSDVPVTISWPEQSPFGGGPIQFKSSDRVALSAGAEGRFKYVVSALDAQEDPEIEIPDV